MGPLIFRFVVGGIIVSAFSIQGDLLKPRSFAGLFSAAPSVALATLTLTILTDGKLYAAREGRSMIAGAVAFFCTPACAFTCWSGIDGARWQPVCFPFLRGLLVLSVCGSWF